MPVLLRQIEGSVLDNFNSEITFISLSTQVGVEDYIKLGTLEAFLQNFTRAGETEVCPTPREFGLLRNKRETFIDLEISY